MPQGRLRRLNFVKVRFVLVPSIFVCVRHQGYLVLRRFSSDFRHFARYFMLLAVFCCFTEEIDWKCSRFIFVLCRRAFYVVWTWLTLVEPRSRFGGKLLKIWVDCPQNETAFLKVRFSPIPGINSLLFHSCKIRRQGYLVLRTGRLSDFRPFVFGIFMLLAASWLYYRHTRVLVSLICKFRALFLCLCGGLAYVVCCCLQIKAHSYRREFFPKFPKFWK